MRIVIDKKFIRLVIFSALLILLLSQSLLSGSGQSQTPDSTGSISGKVIGEDNVRLEGIEVALYLMIRDHLPPPLRTAETDSNGTYSFDILTPGAYILEFHDPAQDYAFEFYTDANYWQAAERIMVSGTDVSDIDIELVRGGVITGTITRGTPAEHRVTLYHQVQGEWDSIYTYQHEALSDIQEVPEYVLRGLPTAIYRICAVSGSYHECYDDIPARDPENSTDISVTAGEIVSDINIVFDSVPYYAHISGIVRNIKGEPLSDIHIYARDEVRGEPYYLPASPISITDKDGYYFMSSYEGGSYTLRFVDPNSKYIAKYYPGVTEYRDQIPVEIAQEQQKNDVDMVLDLAAHITGTVTLRGETGVYSSACITLARKNEAGGWLGSSCPILVYDALRDPIYWSYVSSNSGRYIMDGLPAGEYRLHVMLHLGRFPYTAGILREYYHESETITDATTITLSAGETITGVNLNLGEDEFNSVIEGTIMADSQPLSGMIVEIINSNDFPVLSVHTDSNGNYRFDNLLSGRYQLLARDNQFTFAPRYFGDAILFKDAHLIRVEKNEEVSGIDIELEQSGKISGTIVHLDGEPAPWLTVLAKFVEPSQPNTSIIAVRTMTNEAGGYSFQDLNPGRYHIYVYDSRNSGSFQEYYGCDREPCRPTELLVQEGVAISNIDFIFGPDNKIYLPFIYR